MNRQRYILGLDLGIASVGWAAVFVEEDENGREMLVGLLDCGVRTFDRAEVPKTGDSLAKARREARSVRRLIRRRAHRLLRLRRLLKREGVLTAADFGADGLPQKLPIDVWPLRVAGLDRKLEAKEWAAVLLHLVKHRGYLSQRKSEIETDNKELGRLLAGVAENSQLLQQDEYRTPAELAVKRFAAQSGHMRNKGGDYTHTFNRKDVQRELHLLFERQRALGNPFASTELQSKVDELLMAQRDVLPDENAISRMLGKCTFESEEMRAAKHTYSAERFIWLSKLSNLRIKDENGERTLTQEERKKLLDLPYKLGTVTYQQVRNELAKLGLADTSSFNISYTKKNKKGEYKTKEQIERDTSFMEMKAWHGIKNALEKNGCKTEWQGIATNFGLLDEIGTAFTVCKTDSKIKEKLKGKLSKQVLDVLVEKLSFSKPIQLSMKALKNLLPLMEQGKSYDEAWREVYPLKDSRERQLTLPKIKADEVRNPVVLRTLTQARKVINAVIRRYGPPQRVHIEMARELGKSKKDRDELDRIIRKNRDKNDEAAEYIKKYFGFSPKKKDILKWKLFQQQHGKCLYSGSLIVVERLFEHGYVEIDHALPFSRTWDDSFNNKLLVLGSENQKKRNQTPYEYLDGANNSMRWREFQARVAGSGFPYAKKQRIQTAKLDIRAEEGFRERNLNDTRYIARFLCNFIEENLHLEGSGKRRVFASNGQITALLRGLWGLRKVREENDRHHALDAVVVACSTVSMQQKITQAMQRRETLDTVDSETGEVKRRIPQPWDFFRQEVMIRVFSDTPCEELAEKLNARPQALHEFVSPVFVSRAPNRKMTGQGHLETIKSAKRLPENISVVKKPLTQLKSKDIENIVGYPDRERALYAALQERLAAYNDDPVKAFAEPFYKPAKDGGQGALVKAVRIEDVQKTGVMVRKDHQGIARGIADNATMVRVDVFGKNGKNYLVPVYAWQVAKGILPNKAIVAYADEDDWDEMDESYAFKFSLYPNDLVEVISKKGRIFGYYAGLNRATGAIDIREHDLSRSKVKNGVHQSVGVKIVQSFQKYQTDPLGKEIRLCKAEKRLGLKNKK